MFENVQEVILKVTRDCNLRCNYCYVKDKDKYKGEKMSFDTYKKLINRISTDWEKNNRERKSDFIQIVFHGGEPTLLGINETKKFIRYAKENLPHKNIQFGMQTNLTNLNDEWAALMLENNIAPGISMDGIKSKENELRSYGFDFMKIIKLLNKYKIKYGALMVLSQNNINNYTQITKSFRKFFKQTIFKANFVENINKPEFCFPEISAEQLYNHVFLPTMKVFFKKNLFTEENIKFSLNKFVLNFLYDKPEDQRIPALTNCLEKFCGGGNNIVEVEPDGNVCFCGRWSKRNNLNTIGHIDNPSDLFGLVSLNKALKIHLLKIADMKEKKCDTCYANDICTFGCMAFSYEKYQGKLKIREDIICDYYKKVKLFFLKYRYNILYTFARANNYEIIKKKRSYLLNIPPSNNKVIYQHKMNFNDPLMNWFIYSDKNDLTSEDKIYLELNKKTLTRNIKYQ